MKEQLNKPKGFGEILDLTFSISKKRFSDLFLIMLIIVGPIYLLQAIVQMADGINFFRNAGTGGGNYFINQFSNGFEAGVTGGEIASVSLTATILQGLLGFLSVIFLLIAYSAIFIAVNHMRKGEEHSISSVIKQAFARFWPVLGSTILFGLIYFGIAMGLIFLFTIAATIMSLAGSTIGIIILVVLGLGAFVSLAYFLVRWSLYFGSVVLDKESPGFSRSWRLTKRRGWLLLGLYLILFLMTTVIVTVVQLVFTLILGNSVLFLIIVNMTTMLTTLIFAVGYAVIYLDSKVRYDADDLKDMLQDYNMDVNNHVITE